VSKTELANIPKETVNEFNRKKIEVEFARTEQQHEQLQEQKRELELLEKFDIGANNAEYVQALAEETGDYLLRARKGGVFLNNDFKGKVPFFARNIILCAAETGSGKSTISANLTAQALKQSKKVLVLTNEENPGDVYNRVTCIFKGIAYTNHEKFTDEQVEMFKKNMILMSSRLTVVGDNYAGMTGCTTTIEGIENVLNSLIKKGTEFDVIIFDYYQNIDRSVKAPMMADWQVQYRFCKFLDQYKNRSNACLVVVAQKKPPVKDKELPFREAIEGRKTILNIATCALNVIKDAANFCTLFEIKKSRFNDCVGEKIPVGFSKGEYVQYTQEFKADAHMKRSAKEQAAVLNKVKLTGLNGE
jgi:hypothetical protein